MTLLSNMLMNSACRYRRKREKLVQRTAISPLPTKWGLFQAYCYRSKLDRTEHVAVVKVKICFLLFFSICQSRHLGSFGLANILLCPFLRSHFFFTLKC